MSNRTKVAALTAALALTLSAAPALAQDGAAIPEVPASDLEYQGEITFWNTMRDFEMAEVQKLVDAWQDAHPGITVKHEPQSFDNARGNYQNAAPVGTAPDILRADIGWTIGFADDGYLLDLTDLVDFSDYVAGPLETSSWKGGTYGLPHVTDALGLQCNGELLAEAGLDGAPATWDELVAAGAAVTDLSNQKYGFYTRGDSYWAQPWIWGWGGKLYDVNDDGSVTVTVNSPESVAGWEYLKNEVLGTVAPESWDFASDYDNMSAGFKAGTIMCVMNGPWSVADHLSGAAFADDPSNLVIAPIPEGLPGMTGSPIGGHNYVVYALVAQDEAKQTAVLDLLEYINGSDAQVYLATTLSLLPTRISAYENEAVAADPLMSAWGEVMAKATNRVGHPKSSDQYDPFTREYQAFLKGDKSAQEALDAVAAEWDALFNG